MLSNCSINVRDSSGCLTRLIPSSTRIVPNPNPGPGKTLGNFGNTSATMPLISKSKTISQKESYVIRPYPSQSCRLRKMEARGQFSQILAQSFRRKELCGLSEQSESQ